MKHDAAARQSIVATWEGGSSSRRVRAKRSFKQEGCPVFRCRTKTAIERLTQVSWKIDEYKDEEKCSPGRAGYGSQGCDGEKKNAQAANPTTLSTGREDILLAEEASVGEQHEGSQRGGVLSLGALAYQRAAASTCGIR